MKQDPPPTSSEGILFTVVECRTVCAECRAAPWGFGSQLPAYAPRLSVFWPILCRQGPERSGKGSSAQSAMVSTTTSAPLRVEMVMQSDPAAYSLLTPSG